MIETLYIRVRFVDRGYSKRVRIPRRCSLASAVPSVGLGAVGAELAWQARPNNKTHFPRTINHSNVGLRFAQRQPTESGSLKTSKKTSALSVGTSVCVLSNPLLGFELSLSL